ncbi:WD repeat-containing protein RUP2-like [Cynara cardunculus var. scolymus]|uniref:WD40 repeat-containing protein n=1 Tax=Cynara cardunculus var. scolymus TaxID=59895 RepID=A0A103YDP0_CYNCS|nr:WD repeat-containing protein RUP2-like [Cynara cardunculus var. scolymus]KVI07176.1 WD40 repeat-containing protein [Cynara cardunculus var. scolymus]
MKNFSSESDPILPSQIPDQEERSSAKCEWDFRISAVISSFVTDGPISDTLGVIEVNSSGTLFATGGIARKIRVYSLSSLLSISPSGAEEPPLVDHATACLFCICTPAKLSSLKWKPGFAGRVMGSADYDGVVTEYDLETKMSIFERDEHNGRRVWSMDYSHWDPVVGASGSDDGTMQMWDPRHDGGKCVATVQLGSPVCCVEFCPFGGAMLAVGCADRKAYVYDVRKMDKAVAVFNGHERTVSYTRFLDDRTVMTSGTDGCLKMWDVENQRLIRTYRGHTNQRRFVGLSIWRNEGLIGCGSESNEMFVYDKRWGEPIWVHGFEPEGGTRRSEYGFVSSICWSQQGEDECTLVGGGSDGVVKTFSGKRKPLINLR